MGLIGLHCPSIGWGLVCFLEEEPILTGLVTILDPLQASNNLRTPNLLRPSRPFRASEIWDHSRQASLRREVLAGPRLMLGVESPLENVVVRMAFVVWAA